MITFIAMSLLAAATVPSSAPSSIPPAPQLVTLPASPPTAVNSGITLKDAMPWMVTALFGAAATYIAVYNARRTRLPSVKVLRLEAKQRLGQGTFIELDLLSYGADIYEMQVCLEWQEHGMGLQSPMLQVNPLPSPIKSGQCPTFVMPYTDVKASLGFRVDSKPMSPLSKLPPNAVSICIYSGGRKFLIKRIKGTQLNRVLARFDEYAQRPDPFLQ